MPGLTACLVGTHSSGAQVVAGDPGHDSARFGFNVSKTAAAGGVVEPGNHGRRSQRERPTDHLQRCAASRSRGTGSVGATGRWPACALPDFKVHQRRPEKGGDSARVSQHLDFSHARSGSAGSPVRHRHLTAMHPTSPVLTEDNVCYGSKQPSHSPGPLDRQKRCVFPTKCSKPNKNWGCSALPYPRKLPPE